MILKKIIAWWRRIFGSASGGMTTHHFNSIGVHGSHKLAYVEWGNPENPRVLLCVHGLTRNGRDFDYLAADLSDHYRVICPDMPGRGQSEWLANPGDYNFMTYLADVSMLLTRIGASQIDWVGTSMGGLIGMMLAAQSNSPIRRMVINDVGPFIPAAAMRRIGSYVGLDPRFKTFEELEAHVRRVSAPFGPLSDTQWRHLAETSARQLPDGSYGMSFDPAIGLPLSNPLLINDTALWPMWDAIKCPTLVLRGAISDLLLPETLSEMQRRGPPTEVVEFAGIGHAPMLMDPAQIQIVRNFLLKPTHRS